MTAVEDFPNGWLRQSQYLAGAKTSRLIDVPPLLHLAAPAQLCPIENLYSVVH